MFTGFEQDVNKKNSLTNTGLWDIMCASEAKVFMKRANELW